MNRFQFLNALLLYTYTHITLIYWCNGFSKSIWACRVEQRMGEVYCLKIQMRNRKHIRKDHGGPNQNTNTYSKNTWVQCRMYTAQPLHTVAHKNTRSVYWTATSCSWFSCSFFAYVFSCCVFVLLFFFRFWRAVSSDWITLNLTKCSVLQFVYSTGEQNENGVYVFHVWRFFPSPFIFFRDRKQNGWSTQRTR